MSTTRNDPNSTIHGIEDEPHERGRLRNAPIWLAVALLAVLVFAASQIRDGVSKSNGAWSVSLEYAKVVRAGQPAPLEITVKNEQPIDEPVALQICATWFDAMDFQNWYPNPSSEKRSGDTLEYEFDPTDSSIMRIALDARSAPGRFGAILPCDISISSEGEEFFETSITTWRLP